MGAAAGDVDAGKKGFTLVELMITIAILGFLSWMAVTSFTRLSEQYAVETETKQLYADLMDARGRAMQRSRVFFVRLTASGYSTHEDASPAPDGNGIFDSGQDRQVVSAKLNHAVNQNLSGGWNFSFDRNGIASETGVIWFSSPVKADYDCISVRETRTKMGQYDGAGNCAEK